MEIKMTDGNVQKNSLTKEMKVKLKMEKNLRNSCKNFPEGFEKKDFPYSINNNEDSSKKQLKSFQLAHNNEIVFNKQVFLFNHLDGNRRINTQGTSKDIHPIILALGLQYSEFKICGSNARCIFMLNSFKQVIQDYHTPAGTTLQRHLQSYINLHIAHLVLSRPLSVSMRNAIRFLKLEISNSSIDLAEDEAKNLLIKRIDRFIRDRITVADQVIIAAGQNKINNGDVILIYSRSSIVEQVLIEAYQRHKFFRVIVVDSRPGFEGKECVHRLSKVGIISTYLTISSLCYIMREVTKVFLGAHAMLSNGALYSRVGTSIVAMTAKDNNIPVIVFCESYKFTDRVQLDSFVNNELGPIDNLIDISCDNCSNSGPLSSWYELANLKLLNLMYDVTPAKFINVCVSEMGLLPSTSVSILVHEFK
ncbi:translation initiation factor eIF2B subunit delta [Pneumocystis jirovecii RU7]|uniref:Translation initiation factor eIF2B subunit delta n=1 Tax=Pneumocystis jirovecii (strain RU7) TaxID=1408657 RepID=A0A0W4ZNI0_PNEJ7|nr:translation initiation factor eIF2B subunit delta [Pneumocystis jirovecii RU7]KTW29938.1 hypothetical protein T551_01882 [Pneumocystis jirovecii RU7]